MTKFQKFQPVTIHRSQLKNAPYNPRTITEHARKKLKESLSENGLVETPVWNKRSGNLVGGNQRVGVLDDLEGAQDYLLTVAEIDVDEKTEHKLNLALNNAELTGDWDIQALETIIKGLEGDLSGTGFDDLGLQTMCESDDMTGMFAPKKDVMAPTAEELQGIKDRRQKFKDQSNTKDDTEFYAVLVFGNRQELDEFLMRCQLPVSERYHDGRKVQAMLKEH